MNWTLYRHVIENVAKEDGGGYRIFFPTLGYSVYGVGDTLQETLESFEASKKAFEVFVADTAGYNIPGPGCEDLQATMSMAAEGASCNNFAYAA